MISSLANLFPGKMEGDFCCSTIELYYLFIFFNLVSKLYYFSVKAALTAHENWRGTNADVGRELSSVEFPLCHAFNFQVSALKKRQE